MFTNNLGDLKSLVLCYFRQTCIKRYQGMFYCLFNSACMLDTGLNFKVECQSNKHTEDSIITLVSVQVMFNITG